MIFQSSLGPRKSRCDVLGGTTQGWVCSRNNSCKKLAFGRHVNCEGVDNIKNCAKMGFYCDTFGPL
jgi:hypothetical protein